MNSLLLCCLLLAKGPHHRLTTWVPAPDGFGMVHANRYAKGEFTRIHGRFRYVSAEADDFGKAVWYKPPNNTLFIEDVSCREGEWRWMQKVHVYSYLRKIKMAIYPTYIQDDGLEAWE